MDVAASLEERTSYKNLLTDRESEELIQLIWPQYDWKCRICGERKALFTKHHPSHGNIQHEGACARPDWIKLRKFVPKKRWSQKD
ncbi:unnamed protein product [Trichogramma brassicae]|uniref:Uncharacterized protein n=1 Tax=Trichogramma brassicae TaxID=86971 RepID=A0A6H5IIZ2_9HYME|nr:unnamed protein product [Trichogramma brassicae]